MTEATEASPYTAPVERTSQGLRNALFDEMDALRAGLSNPNRAGALAKLAEKVIASVVMDIEYQKHIATTGPRQAPAVPLPAIALGRQPEKEAA